MPEHRIEDIKISDVYLHQIGGGTKAMAELRPPEKENEYPEPSMFGTLPACGFFLRHVKNLEMSNVEIATEQPDERPSFWLHDVEGSDFFRVRSALPSFLLREVRDFRVFGSRRIREAVFDNAEFQVL